MSKIVDELLGGDNSHVTINKTNDGTKNEDYITTEPKKSVWVYERWYKNILEKNKIRDDTLKGELAARDTLLKCDYLRANIDPYDESRLLDNRQGHWDLDDDNLNKEDMFEVKMSDDKQFFARPPILDVKWGAVCAIDFGTKSTVVVCRDEKNDERMLRVGKGNYAAQPTMKDYENPTVIELVNKNAFMGAYLKRSGRPFTMWEDLTVSHQAAETIEINEESEALFNSVFCDLKQWASAEDSALWLSDQKGEAFKLPPYRELKDNDFDPIEVYAYYLGLYINNMTQGVYLDYIMSYPVTYTPEVRERICRSFSKGLWKSLPPQLQTNEQVKDRFRVYPGASEPAAYAASALKEFNLQPGKDSQEEIAYAVFDFGGGTTDFDFGIMRRGKRTFFEIEQYGSGGDSHLGGENLLELLAYNLYKDNFEVFRANGVHFVLPPEEGVFAGAESFVMAPENASRYAYLNNKYLSKVMRQYWEEEKELTGINNLALFCESSGRAIFRPLNMKKGENIRVNTNKIKNTLRNRIEIGVKNFFAEMEQAFNGHEKYPIHIFLAGNSCRSSIVKALFGEYIEKYRNKRGINDNYTEVYVLHNPLGDDAIKAGMDSEISGNIDQQRTGKTGVAFGLLRMRKGERDIRVLEKRVQDAAGNQHLPFRYYLGRPNYEGLFEVLIDKNVAYGEWKYFTFADENEFYLYYTEQSKALDEGMALTEVQSIYCKFDPNEVSDSDDIGVYICKKSIDEIMYAVGSVSEAEKGNFKNRVYTLRLKED